MTYVFGREVTVKLPEPNYSPTEWTDNGAGWLNGRIGDRPETQQYTSPRTSVRKNHAPIAAPISLEIGDLRHSSETKFSVDDARTLGLRLLAAADYAEHEKPQTLGMPGELVAVDEPTHAQTGGEE